jgi:hypothetical protein
MAGESGWYYVKNGETIGPVGLDELIRQLPDAGGLGRLVGGD